MQSNGSRRAHDTDSFKRGTDINTLMCAVTASAHEKKFPLQTTTEDDINMYLQQKGISKDRLKHISILSSAYQCDNKANSIGRKLVHTSNGSGRMAPRKGRHSCKAQNG